jgi:hypothetical protein
MPKRPRDSARGAGSGSGPSAAKKRYRATLSSSSSARVCGPGIFLTCVRGKERRAADEAVAFLNEVRLAPFQEKQREEKRADRKESKGGGQDVCGRSVHH